ncbi:unnamed protein product [Chrysodeixis includens]|uniref:Uncharacterized protein n=1 Tax=Chrysodeixis includens TaxID=689277 RepID=A0A9N8L095_CHRIL|nr:unnamed protein product [Chrysodeixis includens]
MSKMNPEPMNTKDFSRVAAMQGLHLNDDFVEAMYYAFPGPRGGKTVKLIDMEKLTDFVKRLYPDRRLPPTPPPEPAPPTPPTPSKSKKKK